MSDTDIDTRPVVVNIDHYAGDTLVLHVKVDAAVIGTRVFTAQVRARRTSTKVDGEFDVILTPTGCDLMLQTEVSQRLAHRGPYIGYWDVQLSHDGDDPVTTLAHGEIRLDPDVTRKQQP